MALSALPGEETPQARTTLYVDPPFGVLAFSVRAYADTDLCPHTPTEAQEGPTLQRMGAYLSLYTLLNSTITIIICPMFMKQTFI